jgi:hypothetical protein
MPGSWLWDVGDLVRSATSPVITPLSAEYGRLFAEYTTMRMMYVAYAHASLPDGLRSGVVKVRKPMMPNGTAVQSTHGRNFPHRVFVRSATMPMSGSKTASNTRTTRNSVPAAAAVMPKVSV